MAFTEKDIFPLLSLTQNEYHYLENFIVACFGKEYSFINTIKKHERVFTFQFFNQRVRTIDDISEIDENEIMRIIKLDEQMQNKALSITKYFESKNIDDLTEEEIIHFAKEFGIYPLADNQIYKLVYPYNTLSNEQFFKICEETFPYSIFPQNSLYGNLIPFYAMTEKEIEEYKLNFKNHIRQVKGLFTYLLDDIRNKFIHKLKNGRVCIEYGYTRNFYRGENAFYGSSKAGLYRNNNKVDYIDKIISIIKSIEIKNLYRQFRFSQMFENDTLYLGAFAQHYGLKTICIDITSDIKVALFFACCTFDKETNQWRPLNENDFTDKYSRRWLKDLNGDSRFAVIYKTPADIVKMSNSLKDGPYKNVYPIGYQPFLRSESQKGFLLETDEFYNLYLDRSFQKYKFRLNESFCKWIFEEMQGGKKLFPDEIILHIEDLLNDISELKEYNYSSIEYVYNEYKDYINISLEELISKIESKGHKCLENKVWCNVERVKEIENKWYEFYHYNVYENSNYRLCFSIGVK